MKNFPGVKFGTDSKNWWGKNEITQYYTPVAGEWPNYGIMVFDFSMMA